VLGLSGRNVGQGLLGDLLGCLLLLGHRVLFAGAAAAAAADVTVVDGGGVYSLWMVGQIKNVGCC